MTKADVLDAFKELELCTAYKIDGKESREIPFRIDRLKIDAVYQKFPGWNTPTSAAKSFGELPDTMKTYVDFINNYLGVKVKYISNGPGRDQIINI
jgi:adenylosuccinate synthase